MTEAKPTRPAWFRKNYVIDPKLQFKIVGLLGGLALVMATIVCLIAYERLMRLDELFNNRSLAPALLPNAFKQIADSLMYRLIGIVSIMTAGFVGLGVLLTHRVAGPIWRLQNELQKFLKGEKIRPLSFRRGDEFQHLPQIINQVLDKTK